MKTIISQKKIKIITEHIADGNYMETACQAAGIAENTFYGWLKRAEAYLSNNNIELSDVDEKWFNKRIKKIRKDGEIEYTDPEIVFLQLLKSTKMAEAQLETLVVHDMKMKTLRSDNTIAHAVFLSRRFKNHWAERPSIINVQVQEKEESLKTLFASLKKDQIEPVINGEFAEVKEKALPAPEKPQSPAETVSS
jgi:hypothetical protein